MVCRSIARWEAVLVFKIEEGGWVDGLDSGLAIGEFVCKSRRNVARRIDKLARGEDLES